ncbi:MAG: DUF6789 family protein [Candidatus Hydrothermarchaeales archaeon]
MVFSIVEGIIAGIVATVVMTIPMMIMAAKGKMEISPPKMLASKLGLEKAWMGVHFLVGIVFAVLYVVISNALALGTHPIVYPTIYAVAVPWLILMVVMLPMNNLGLFGLQKSKTIPVMTFAMHVLYGLAMGASLAFL